MPFERLWLVASCARPVQVVLNDQVLGTHQDPWVPFEADISPIVRPSNELRFMLEAAVEGLPGPVYLEVRRDVHLAGMVGVAVWESTRPRLRLTGQIRGEPSRPLSFVVRLDEREVLYQDLPRSESLDVTTPELEVRQWQAGQTNVLYQLDFQLLDPACVLSQHGFLTGFRAVVPGPGESRLDGVHPWVETVTWQEPLDESPVLIDADRQGKLLVLSHPRANPATSLPWLWQHPSVVGVASCVVE